MDEPTRTTCSVVIPCRDEEQSLPILVPAVLDAIQEAGCTAQIVLVDDGSSDSSLDVMRKLGQSLQVVSYLALSRNFGKEAAMFAGMQMATGDLVIIMDADGQHPPAVITALIAEQQATGADQVVARRDRTGDPRLRTLASGLFYRVSNRLSEIELVNGDGDFRLLTRRATDAVLSLSETNRFSKGIFSWIGFPTRIVTYPNQARLQGTSSWNRSRLIDYGVDGLISFNSRPLRIVIYLGWFAVLIGLAYVVFLIILRIINGISAPGYVTVVAAIVFIGGVQLISIGVVGEYVGRIFIETKRRPLFLIAEKSDELMVEREVEQG